MGSKAMQDLFFKILVAAFLGLTLTACGGGGGGSSAPPPAVEAAPADSDGDGVAGNGDPLHVGNRSDVDHLFRLREAQLEGRDQRHATRQEHHVVAAARRFHGVVGTGGFFVIEVVHLSSPYSAACLAPLSACQILSGVAGISMLSTPATRNASVSALMTAAGVPMAPASPQPLAPMGLWVHGVWQEWSTA